MNIIILFVLLSLVNVIFGTIRSLSTINGSALSAALINGGYFAFYNIVLIYTVADFPLWVKCLITFACNVIGVFLVKYIEKKARKDKLWKIECTVPVYYTEATISLLEHNKIPFNYIENVGKYTIFNMYCATQAQTAEVHTIISNVNGKYFISESKNF